MPLVHACAPPIGLLRSPHPREWSSWLASTHCRWGDSNSCEWRPRSAPSSPPPARGIGGAVSSSTCHRSKEHQVDRGRKNGRRDAAGNQKTARSYAAGGQPRYLPLPHHLVPSVRRTITRNLVCLPSALGTLPLSSGADQLPALRLLLHGLHVLLTFMKAIRWPTVKRAGTPPSSIVAVSSILPIFLGRTWAMGIASGTSGCVQRDLKSGGQRTHGKVQ